MLASVALTIAAFAWAQGGGGFGGPPGGGRGGQPGGPTEAHAWPVHQGATAPEAAGKIHTDLQNGFIRAETVAFTDLDQYGSMAECRKHGLVRLEGKEYVVKDGDVLDIRFSR